MKPRRVTFSAGDRAAAFATASLCVLLFPAPAVAKMGDTGGFSWDSTDRTAVVAAFARTYLPSEGYQAHTDWYGDVDVCVADSVSREFLDDTLRRINWFRAQAGVAADVSDDPSLNDKVQQTALIMAEQDALSHFPATDFPDNPCLSIDGAAAAAKSNLARGAYGPGAIDFLMRDTGGNNAAVGHRRWTLYLRQKVMGNGSIPPTATHLSTHVQYVFDSFKPAPPARAVAWPNEGFVPWQVVPDDGDTPTRWSFSYPGADFSNAAVSVERVGDGGGFLAVTSEAVVNGYGDNTVVWRVAGVPDARPAADTTYRVVVSGVAAAPQSTFSYDVTVIDPYDLGIDLEIDGPPHPLVDKTSTYEFGGFAEADGYGVRVSHADLGTWIEGAEDETADRVLDQTSASYALRDATVHADGARSFHLTVPGFEENGQAFTIDRVIAPSAASLLRFKDLRRCVTNASVLEAQISLDGNAWQTLWSRSGKPVSGCSSATDWDKSFQSVEVPIPAEFAGRTATVRFVFTAGSPAFLGTSSSVGFFIDSVSVTDSEELVDPVVTSLKADATGFQLDPLDRQELWLQVRGQIGEVAYAWSRPAVVVPVVTACGDANDDGKISAADALLVLKAAVGSASCALDICDANGSQSVSAADALLILKKAVGSAVTMDCPLI